MHSIEQTSKQLLMELYQNIVWSGVFRHKKSNCYHC